MNSAEPFPLIGELAPLGDGRSAALIGPDGAVEFFCPLRFDAPALVFPLLDRTRGGRLRIGPAAAGDDGAGPSCRRRYLDGTAVLVLEWAGRSGSARVTMAMAWPAPEHGQELLWLIEGLEGSVDVEAVFDPRPGFGADDACPVPTAEGARLEHPNFTAGFAVSGINLHLNGAAVHGHGALQAGDRWAARLRLDPAGTRPVPCTADPVEVAAALAVTAKAWQDWTSHLVYDGPGREAVLRAAITLKLLIYAPTGAVTAAVSTSLPEDPGGERNWDYRYTWLRDASFTLNALYQLNCRPEAAVFARWLCRTTAAGGLPLRVLYRIDGTTQIPEASLTELDGYRSSRPVRTGNAAETQLQLDSYGELLDCLSICEVFGEDLMRREWSHFRRLVDFTAAHWHEPDSGIWEVRSRPRHFVHSKALAWTALDRGARLAELHRLPGDISAWREAAGKCRAEVFESGVRDGHFIRAYDDPGMDAALLLLPIVGFVAGDDPIMLATVDAVRAELTPGDTVLDGLLYRYLPARPGSSGDGLDGAEGAFAIASFWLVESLALAGRTHEAEKLFAGLAALGGELGNLAEEIDPATGEQLGNTPQAFTHIGLINAGLRLAGTSTKGRPTSRTIPSTPEPRPTERIRVAGRAVARQAPAATMAPATAKRSTNRITSERNTDHE